MSMENPLFQKYKKLIYQYSGIDLKDSKKTMLVSRINKRLKNLKINSYEQYFDYVTKKENGNELVMMIDEITTNITHFFRDETHFDFLQTHLQELLKASPQKIRIWCCAASTGQEPYSIAMVLHDVLTKTNSKCDAKILATDLSTQVLETCKEGVYSQELIENVPPKYANRYFQKNTASNDLTIDPCLKRLVSFKRLNLSKFPFPLKNKLDIVFIRNVMIYFDKPTKSKIIHEIFNLLKPSGVVITSSTESLNGLHDQFQRVQPSIYQPMATSYPIHKASA